MAYSLVGEIISLLSDLVSEKTAEQVWGTAIKQVSTVSCTTCQQAAYRAACRPDRTLNPQRPVTCMLLLAPLCTPGDVVLSANAWLQDLVPVCLSVLFGVSGVPSFLYHSRYWWRCYWAQLN